MLYNIIKACGLKSVSVIEAYTRNVKALENKVWNATLWLKVNSVEHKMKPRYKISHIIMFHVIMSKTTPKIKRVNDVKKTCNQ